MRVRVARVRGLGFVFIPVRVSRARVPRGSATWHTLFYDADETTSSTTR